MRLLHEYNLESLEEIKNEVQEISSLLTLGMTVFDSDNRVTEGFSFLLHQLEDRLSGVNSDFETRIQSILSFSVPPEGEESVPKLVYPSSEK